MPFPKLTTETAAANNAYFLPDNYCHNQVFETSERDGEYWTANRIAKSGDYQHQVYRLAKSIADKQSAKTILDVGCGVGTKLCSHFDSPFRTYGIDLPDAISHCQRLHPNREWLSDDLSKPVLGQSSLNAPADIIICADVVEHLAKPETLLSYIRSFACSNTSLILSTPERTHLLGQTARHPSNPEHVREWTKAEFRTFLEAHGWKVVQQSVVFPFKARPNGFTLRYLKSRILNRRSFCTCQVAVCRLKDVEPSERING